MREIFPFGAVNGVLSKKLRSPKRAIGIRCPALLYSTEVYPCAGKRSRYDPQNLEEVINVLRAA